VLISIHTTGSKSVPPVKTNWQRTSIEWQNPQIVMAENNPLGICIT